MRRCLKLRQGEPPWTGTTKARVGAALALALLPAGAAPPPRHLVLWAWERPEDLRFAGPDVDVAILAGSILLSGDTAAATPRRQPALVLPAQHLVGVVHVEIDRTRPLAWTPEQRARTTAAILWLTRDPRLAERQVDLEVRRSERPVLLSLLADLRAALPRATLSMTALASWCDTERWISAAPVDQVVPMLFRMGPGGAGLRARLAAGGDLADPACRTALGVATDTALPLVPPGRRMFLFDPRPWTAADLQTRTGPP